MTAWDMAWMKMSSYLFMSTRKISTSTSFVSANPPTKNRLNWPDRKTLT